MSSEWSPYKLRELVSIKHGFAFKGEYFANEETPVQLTTPGNFAIGGGFQVGKGKYYAGPVPEDYILHSGDLVVTMTDLSKAADTLGYAAVVPDGTGTTWLHNQRVGLIRPREGVKVDMGYIHYLMRGSDYRHWVVSTATGSTVKHTSPDRILSFEFLLPPFAEQRAIGEMLAALDNRITLLRETNSTLEAIAQALFKSWFVDFDPVRAKAEGRQPEGMDDPTAALFPDSFVESELGMVPKGWRVGSLGDIASIKGGKQLAKEFFKDRGVNPIFGGAGVMGHTDLKNAEGFVITVGRVGAYCGQFFWHLGEAWVNNNASHIQPMRNLDAVWIYQWLRATNIDHIKKGAAQPFVSNGDLAELKLALPIGALVDRFVEVVGPVYEQMASLQAQAQTLTQLRDTLLPRLISGQLRLPEAEALIEVAV